MPVFELLKEHLAGYTPEKAAVMCDVSPDMIRTLARKVSGRRGTIFCGGTSFKYYHSDLMVRAYLLVLALTGNWGRKGTGPGEWSVAGFDGPFIFGGKQQPGLEETRRVLDMREAAIQMFKDQDPTRTEEMAHIRCCARCRRGCRWCAGLLLVLPLRLPGRWNRPEWNDPTMQRRFDEYFDESIQRGWCLQRRARLPPRIHRGRRRDAKSEAARTSCFSL
jgi:hypothetical protein